MHVWRENEYSRGATEAGLCLLRFFEGHLDSSQTKLRASSDNCVGQNKNRFVVPVLLVAVQKKYLNDIVWTFPEVEGTYLACDRDFGLCEKPMKVFLEL